jgi:hypothetical protein
MAMNHTLTHLLDKFNFELAQDNLPPELGGFYKRNGEGKSLVVNQVLPYEKKIEICFELIFRHCLDDCDQVYIPYTVQD